MDKKTAIPFDQYQRYGVASRAIESLRRNGESLNILEVGANTHKLLGRLLPLDNIIYLDREVPPEMQEQGEMVLGDATNLTLPDASYDVVVALDVFEHIPEDRRKAFIEHTCRVARLLTIIAAPFDSESTVKAEQEASDYWDSLFNYPYRWLAEHSENGLPNLDLSAQMVIASGYHLHTLKHGDISLWIALLKAHFAKERVNALSSLIFSLDQYYRDHFFERDFSPSDTYRQFLLCSRDADVVNKLQIYFDAIELNAKQNNKNEDFLSELLKLLPSIAVDINSQINNLNQVISERDAVIKAITSSYSWRITRPLRFFVRLFRQFLKSLAKK